MGWRRAQTISAFYLLGTEVGEVRVRRTRGPRVAWKQQSQLAASLAIRNQLWFQGLHVHLSLQSSQQPWFRSIIKPIFTDKDKEHTEQVSNLSKVTELVISGAGI